MLPLNFKLYELACSDRGKKYFPYHKRSIIIANIRFNYVNYFGEYAPFKNIHLYDSDHVMDKIYNIIIDQDFFLTNFNHQFYPPINYMLSMMHLSYNFSSFFHHDKHIKLCGLVDDQDIISSINRAKSYVSQGIRCIKLKLGHDILYEIKKILSLASILPSSMKLRIDANKKLSIKDARLLLSHIKDVPIDYIEEPLIDAIYASELCREYGLKLAIDESFSHPFNVHSFYKLNPDFLIIKPSRFHSVYDVIKWGNIAKSKNIIPIFSTVFETFISTITSMMMIYHLDLAHLHHGIMIDDIFISSLGDDLPIIDGGIYMSQAYQYLLRGTDYF